MKNVTFENFVSYLENLTIQHREICHLKNNEKHFVRLDTDEQDIAVQSQLFFPAVFLDRYSARISGSYSNFNKTRYISLMILDKIPDALDFNRIHDTWDRCELIGDDFIQKINTDFRNGNIALLKSFDLAQAEYELCSNISLNLFGVMVTFPVDYRFCEKPRPGIFAE